MNRSTWRPLPTTTLLLLSCVMVASLWTAPAAAQTAYKCTRDGSTYYSDRPCPGDGKTVTTVQPTQPAQGSTPPRSRRGGADQQELLRYLGPHCRGKATNILWLQQQATRADDDSRMHQRLEQELMDYNENCAADEQQALEKMSRKSNEVRERERAQQEAERAAQQQLTLSLAQCTEMRRIRDQRRSQLATLTAGERGDFERFEANFASRCANLAAR
jgi:Domain of unknown function (DUF4124)